MKEYWVNVYGENDCEWLGGKFDFNPNMKMGIIHKYRLHIREFETREAKELYLKMKYGKQFGYMPFGPI